MAHSNIIIQRLQRVQTYNNQDADIHKASIQ